VSRSARRALLGALALALAVPGPLACGYTPVRYGDGDGNGDADPPAVAVALLANDSHDPGYELVVSDALRREFARRGGLRLVPDPEAAEVVLSGRIQPIATVRRSFSSVVLALEYEVRVALELEVERAGGSLAVDRRVLTERELYLASADVEAMRKNREEALRRVAEVLASRVHDVVYELAP